jgi:TonB family protein
MSSEVRQVSRDQGSRQKFGSLQGCLVDGDPEQRKRERRVRRRSLVISIATQGVVLAAIVLIPLFGKPARILANVMPLPPYYAHGQAHPADPARPRVPQQHNVCRFCLTQSIPNTIVMHTEATESGESNSTPGFIDGPPGTGDNLIPLSDSRVAPPPPDKKEDPPPPHKVHVTQIDPAMLRKRVEPIYPTLMRQIGRSGQVQLHAIIGTDGTIQSLQVVSGDPGFYQSALEAVRQWRYKPTELNGNVVEVDTFITVIYNIAR